MKNFELERMFSLVSTLSGVRRFSIMKLAHQENVLEHIGMVAIFSYLLGLKINSESDDKISIERLLCKAIVHDFDECVTGDIIRPTKYFSSSLREELAKLEESGVARISDNFGLVEIYSDYMSSKKELDGMVVKVADLLAAGHRVWEEVLVAHNYVMISAGVNMIPVVEKLLDSLWEINNTSAYRVLHSQLKELQIVLQQVSALSPLNPLEEITP